MESWEAQMSLKGNWLARWPYIHGSTRASPTPASLIHLLPRRKRIMKSAPPISGNLQKFGRSMPADQGQGTSRVNARLFSCEKSCLCGVNLRVQQRDEGLADVSCGGDHVQDHAGVQPCAAPFDEAADLPVPVHGDGDSRAHLRLLIRRGIHDVLPAHLHERHVDWMPDGGEQWEGGPPKRESVQDRAGEGKNSPGPGPGPWLAAIMVNLLWSRWRWQGPPRCQTARTPHRWCWPPAVPRMRLRRQHRLWGCPCWSTRPL